VGRPGDDPTENLSQVEPALRSAAEKLASTWGQKLAELPVHMIELPGFRLAGAEEGLRHAIALIERVLRHHEPLLRDLTDRAKEAYSLVRPRSDSKRRPCSAQTQFEQLRNYAKARFHSLVLEHVQSTFLTLSGQMSDALREVNFCRVRLTEL